MTKELDTQKNYRVVGLSKKNTVMLDIDGRGRVDSEEPPSHFGTWGLDHHEIAILKRGLTASGADKNPNERRGRPKKK